MLIKGTTHQGVGISGILVTQRLQDAAQNDLGGTVVWGRVKGANAIPFCFIREKKTWV